MASSEGSSIFLRILFAHNWHRSSTDERKTSILKWISTNVNWKSCFNVIARNQNWLRVKNGDKIFQLIVVWPQRTQFYSLRVFQLYRKAWINDMATYLNMLLYCFNCKSFDTTKMRSLPSHVECVVGLIAHITKQKQWQACSRWFNERKTILSIRKRVFNFSLLLLLNTHFQYFEIVCWLSWSI